MRKDRILAVLFGLLLVTTSSAQQIERHPLQKVLTTLEQRYRVTFTYADMHIEGVFVAMPSRKFGLKESLLYLHESTGLTFHQLNDRYIAISKEVTEQLTICGVVMSADTRQTVSGATIRSGSSFSISDERGYFHLSDISKDDTLHIRFLGYKAIGVPVKDLLDQPCRQITIEPEFTTLEEISVSDFITEGIDKRTDGALMMDTETLGLLPGLSEPDVLQAIQTLPGIQSIDESISDINVRGGTNDQNLVLWDGIRMFQSGHFFGLISAFSPYLTRKVVLTKNGTGAYFGDGVSSTIDIRTDDRLTRTFSGGAGFNMINSDLFGNIPVSDKISMQVSSRRSVADFLQTPTYRQYFERAFRDTDVTDSSGVGTLLEKGEKFYFYDASVKVLCMPSNKDKLAISFLKIFNDIEYQENALLNNVIESRTSGLKQGNIASGVTHSRLWNDKVRTSVQLYLSSYELWAVNYDLLNNQTLIQRNSILDTGVKADTRISCTDNFSVFTGYQFAETGVTNRDEINNPVFRRSTKNVVRQHAAFAEGDLTADRTNIRFGVRSHYFPTFDKTIIEPRLSFNQTFFQHFTFEVLGEMKNQTISQVIDLQSDFLGVEKRRWILSNDNNVPIIRSKQISAGIYFRRNGLLISAESYYKFVQGIITSSQGFQNQFQFIRSTGNYESVGMDFFTTKKFDRFTTLFSYTISRSTFQFRQLIPPIFPSNLDVRHRVTVNCGYRARNLEVSAGMNWHSGAPTTLPVENNEIVNNAVNYNPPNSARLDDYLRIDFSARYHLNVSAEIRFQTGVSVWNIFNRENTFSRYFIINESKQLASFRQSSLGITPNIFFRMEF